MFECRACTLRFVRAITGDGIRAKPINKTPFLLTPHQGQRHTSTARATKPVSTPPLVPGKQPYENEQASNGNGTEDSKQRLQIPNRQHLERELQYLTDRVKLAQHVQYTLRNNDPKKALNLCRLASKTQECIVAWNHCVDWHMQHHEFDAAIKIYNEMKKRAQFPDSYTYILLLRGLAKVDDRSDAKSRLSNVQKALGIYNSMFGPTSRVKPATIHANAMMHVCRVAKDMDTIWGVVARMPSHGFGSPDSRTYATLLTAIRTSTISNVPSETPREMQIEKLDRAVQEGRRIWQEIIPRWRDGEVEMDEQLVTAMGKLLLISVRLQDWDDTLNLVQQTMNVERLLAPLGHRDRNVEHVPQVKVVSQPVPEPKEDSAGYVDAPSTKAFLPVTALPKDPTHPKRSTSLAWAQPGNATLSMIIEACNKLHSPKTATAYWSLFASTYGIKFNLDNFHDRIKLLVKNRSSARVLDILHNDLPASGIEPTNLTFRLAMEAVVRDKNNPSHLDHALGVVDVMEQNSPDLDVRVLSQYLDLTLRSEKGPKIVATLHRLEPLIDNLRSRVNYGSYEMGGLTPEMPLAERQEINNFLRAVVGVIDTLMNRGMVPREKFKIWHAKRSRLTEFIGRTTQSNQRSRKRLEGGEVEMGGAEDGNTGMLETSGRNARSGSMDRTPEQSLTEGWKWGPVMRRFRGKPQFRPRFVTERPQSAASAFGNG